MREKVSKRKITRKSSPYIIGTSGWGYDDWRGEFYPEGLAKKDWFAYYKKHFNIVEINATAYRLFPDHVFEKWRKQAGANFKYIIKTPRFITHILRLYDCKKPIKRFCRSLKLLDNKLALILLQLPPTFAYDVERLREAILHFDDPTKVVVEFRNKLWYTDEVREMLTEIGCVFCAADSPNTELTPWLTSKNKIAYIRLHGRKKWFDYHYTKKELNEVVAFAKKMKRKGAKKIFILLNNDYYAYAIDNAQTLDKLLK